MITDNHKYKIHIVLPPKDALTRLVNVEDLVDESPVKDVRSIRIFERGYTYTGAGGDTIVRYQKDGDVVEIPLVAECNYDLYAHLGREVLLLNVADEYQPLQLRADKKHNHNSHSFSRN